MREKVESRESESHDPDGNSLVAGRYSSLLLWLEKLVPWYLVSSMDGFLPV